MDLGISGKKALVCGASKGIGRAIAKQLLSEGVEVLLTARNASSLDETLAQFNADGHMRAVSFACDLSNSADRQRLIDHVHQNFGEIDILIHNTGGPSPTSVEETTADAWQKGFDQLFQMVAELNNAFLPGMKQRQWGRILAVTSSSVLEPIPNLAVSNSIRAAVTSMLKTLADEVAKFNVTINCLAPGAIQTDRLEDLMEARVSRSGQSKDDYMNDYLRAIPAGRLGKPSEFAAVAAFLCSEQAAYITGSTISIDGGKRRSVH